MTDLPGTDWDVEAQLAVDGGLDLAEARDLVIGRYMVAGDMRPFSEWVLQGHQPSSLVLTALAWITRERVPDSIADKLPFALTRKLRKGGKNSRPDPGKEFRDWLLAKRAREAGAGEPGMYDAGIKAVVDLIGDQRAHQTVRDAYDKHYSRKPR